MRTSILETGARARRKLAAMGVLALAITGVASVVLGTSSAATTLVVDDDLACPGATYPTISLAVAAASAGDTIQVCAGTYNEGVSVNKSLTFNGPNAGASALGARGPEAIVTTGATTFNVLVPDVTIDGFTINGDFGIYSNTPSSSGVNTLNNIITGTSRALSYDGPGTGIDVIGNHLISPVRQIHLAGSAFADMAVNGNRFSGAGSTFYNGNGSIAGYEFKDNEVVNGNNNHAAKITNGDVSGNTFTPSGPSTLSLQINLHDSTLTDNTFNGSDTHRCLQIFGVQFGLDPSENVLISENTFNDCSGTAAPANNMYALQLSQGVDGIDVTGNDFSSTTGDAVNTRNVDGTWTLNPDIHINRNNITGSTGFGVNNAVMGTLDAECNWWGAANGPGPVGPGSGDKVSTGVDFTPWLTAPAPGGPCPVPPPSKDACKNGGWMNYTDDQARPFKNQGDCVSYVATKGKNKAAG